MSLKESKLNSPRINSEYMTTISSSNYPISQSMLSSNSKEFKTLSQKSQLICTCNHQKTKIKQNQKNSSKLYKKNITNIINTDKTESRKSRFAQEEAYVKYTGFKTYSNSLNNSKLVCTCKNRINNSLNKMKVFSQIKQPNDLWKQNIENLQILSAPAPELIPQYVQNLAIIQKSEPISNYIKLVKDDRIRKIRANIIKVKGNEKTDKNSSSSSDYDVLQNITKYKGDLKYKYLVNQSLELIQQQSSDSKEIIDIKTHFNDSEIQEKLANKKIFHFIKNQSKENKDLEKDNQYNDEVPFSSDVLDNSPDIIHYSSPEPDDYQSPGELISKEDSKEDIKNKENKEIEKNLVKNANINNIDNQGSKIETEYINMKIEGNMEENNPIVEDLQQNEEMEEKEYVPESYEYDESAEKKETLNHESIERKEEVNDKENIEEKRKIKEDSQVHKKKSNPLLVCLKSSVKRTEGKKEEENSFNDKYYSSEGFDSEPKNSLKY